MKYFTLTLTALSVASASPVYACLETSPEAKKWVYCSQDVAKNIGEWAFLKNYINAVYAHKTLLPTAGSRWAALYKKIYVKCGAYNDAYKKDIAEDREANAPKNIMDAYIDVGLD
jgi:hypothetical protein